MAAEPVVYGIPNCDSVKRARQWLAQRGVAVRFHDFKKLGVPPPQTLAAWAQAVGWTVLVNRQGTTWRQLADADKAALAEPGVAAFACLQAHASVIKRPVVAWPDGVVTVGMDAVLFEQRVAANMAV
jgi:arsenate reductase